MTNKWLLEIRLFSLSNSGASLLPCEESPKTDPHALWCGRTPGAIRAHMPIDDYAIASQVLEVPEYSNSACRIASSTEKWYVSDKTLQPSSHENK